MRLVPRDRPPLALLELQQFVLIGAAVLVDRDLDRADLGEPIGTEPAENIGNSPKAEGDNDETHHHSHDRAAEPSLAGSTQSIEHIEDSPRSGKRMRPSGATIGRHFLPCNALAAIGAGL